VHPDGSPFFYSTVHVVFFFTGKISDMATVKSCIVVLFFLALTHSAGGSDYSLPRVDNLIEKGGYIVTKNDHIVAQHNPGKLFIPASTLKIATSLAALSILSLFRQAH
jgi:hypothetical protein